jgi:FkbM family methyltransferase
MLIPYKTITTKYGINPTGALHIGANTGQELEDYYNNGVERSIWIEANPDLLPELVERTLRFPETLVYEACLTDKDGEKLSFKISNNEGQSSSILDLDYHTIAHPEVTYVKEINVTTSRLDTLFKENGLNIDDYPFVNIDVQGAELLVLKGFGELLHKVKYLYVEVNQRELYRGCALLPELEEYLAGYGFERKELQWAGNFGWGDALYIRK